MGMSWTAERLNDILQITVDFAPRRDWEQWVLLRSDAHWDNTKSDRSLMREHLEEAKEYDAIVLDGGDLFCAMQGKGDPRSSKNALRAEHTHTNYLDALVKTAAKWHKPYAKQIAMLAHGNHELSVYDRKETDLTARLADRLGENVHAMPISGFVRFTFKDVNNPKATNRYDLYYHHGYGGGGPVTKDVIQNNRRSVFLSTDIVWSGHTHDGWYVPQTQLHVTQGGKVRKRIQHHVKTPSYKDDFNKGKSGWANIKGHPPKPVGAVWLRFYYKRNRKTSQREEVTSRRVHLQVIPDIRGDVQGTEV